MAKPMGERVSTVARGRTVKATKSKGKKSVATTKTATATVVDADAGDAIGNEADYERHLADAMALDAPSVKTFRADAPLAATNARAGAVWALANRAAIDAHIKDVKWDLITETPSLASAVCFAAARAEGTVGPANTTSAKLTEVRGLREVLLTSADALVVTGLFSAAAVAKVRAGSGSIDLAQDCVDLAAMYRTNAAKIRGKHGVTAQQIARAAALGSELLETLRPGRAKRGAKPSVVVEAADVRNRMWTLLVKAHTHMRQIAAYLWLDDAHKYVPLLQSARPTHKHAKTPKTPAPAITAKST